MSKVMLVEDDDSLREIYSIRLTAEGYNIVSARDGEEALAIAVRERPDLIVSDVMMPKITGFDMLDILRSTPETQNIKVIMMTALSSEDERIRGENLGADRYLVKSQVGIEDVVNAVHDVLGDRSQDGTISAVAPQNSVPSATPMGETPTAATSPVSVATSTAAPAAIPVQPVAQVPVAQPTMAPPVAAPPVIATTTAPTVAPTVMPTASVDPTPVAPVAVPETPTIVSTAAPAAATVAAPTVAPTIAPVA